LKDNPELMEELESKLLASFTPTSEK